MWVDMPKVDQISFWIGFAGGILFAWFLTFIRRGWPYLATFARQQIQSAKNNLTASTETRLRNDMLRLAQQQHLASAFAALDEVLVPPALLIPPISVDPENSSIIEASTQQAIPYLPDWPELAATFCAPTLTLPEALQGNANLILMGQPGSGKTVALAHLTSLFARNDPQVSKFGNLVPVYIHAGDLDPLSTEKEPLTPFLNALASHMSPITLPRLPVLLRNLFISGRVILMLDGLDEYGPEDTKLYIEMVSLLLERYPLIRIVIATSLSYYDGLTKLGFVPVAMAAWDVNLRSQFLNNWRNLWSHLLTTDNQQPDLFDLKVISGWLTNRETPPNPLVYTLKVWSAFAGDALGSDVSHDIEAYIRRMTINVRNTRPALEKLANQMLFAIKPIARRREAETWIAEYDINELSPTEVERTKSQGRKGKKKLSARPPSNLIPTLISNGLLVSRRGSYLCFVHPILLGYLCGASLAKTGEVWNVQNQPDWIGKTVTLQFLASFGNVGNLVENLLASWDDALKRGVLTAGRWLHYAPKNAPWRIAVMRALASTMQKEHTTLGVSARALTALGLTEDPNLSTLFRQFHKSGEPNLRLLGILGCGMANDDKIIADLASMVEDPVPYVKYAACLALMTIGNKAALDAITLVLLQGSDTSRQVAAEALAMNPEEGYPILQEGAGINDLLVRHAVVFGLARIKLPWAVQLLEKMAIEDGQWVVRNAAAAALENSKRSDPHIPIPLPPLNELPWLIKYAAKSGSGVSPGSQAIEFVTNALKDGNDDERLAALDYVRLYGNDNFVLQVYHLRYGSKDVLREAAFNTLWHLAAAGISLPSPNQYGLG